MTTTATTTKTSPRTAKRTERDASKPTDAIRLLKADHREVEGYLQKRADASLPWCDRPHRGQRRSAAVT